MSAVTTECDRIHWNAFAHVDKYSPDQDAWAQRKFAEEKSWGGVGARESVVANMIRRITHRPLVPLLVQGEDYRRYFAEPENGIAEADGNLLTTGGLEAIFARIAGLTVANTQYSLGQTAWAGTTTNAGVGVGSTTTAAAIADIHLGADGTTPNGTVGANYQVWDAGFPAIYTVGPPTLLTSQCTFASASALFAWQEWCWTTGTGSLGAIPQYTLSTTYGTAASYCMLNHKIASLGTKASGAAWVFTTTVSLT